MIRIAYLFPHIRCEPNRTQYQRLKSLSSENWLYVFTEKGIMFPKFPGNKNIRLVRAPIRFGRAQFLYSLWCVYKVLILNRKFRFDLVYSSFHYFSYVAAFMLKLLGFRWVIDFWDSPELGLEVWKMSKKSIKNVVRLMPSFLAYEILKRMLRKADLVISVIHPSALTSFRVDKRKIFAITNGVDLSITKPKGLKRDLSDFIVFYVGYVRTDRGLGLLLNAAKILKEKIENFKLILVGDARKDDTDVIRRFNLKEVNYLGRLEHKEVLSMMERSDICVFPFPRKKVFDCIYPVKIFEYMAMGKAIVATRLKGTSGVIRDGVNGSLVEPDDPREMADAIFRIYENPDLRKRLELNARKAAKKYDWKIINEKINEKLAECFE